MLIHPFGIFYGAQHNARFSEVAEVVAWLCVLGTRPLVCGTVRLLCAES